MGSLRVQVLWYHGKLSRRASALELTLRALSWNGGGGGESKFFFGASLSVRLLNPYTHLFSCGARDKLEGILLTCPLGASSFCPLLPGAAKRIMLKLIVV